MLVYTVPWAKFARRIIAILIFIFPALVLRSREARRPDALDTDAQPRHILGMDDAAAVEQQLHMSVAKPLLLPIMYKPSNADLAAAMQQYGAVLKAPDHVTHFLSVIDDAMKARKTGIANP